MRTKVKPDKFPLHLHASGQWAKKVRGRRVYFGSDKKLNAGIRLLVGTEPEIASLIDRPEGRLPMVGPTTFLLPSRSNGAPTGPHVRDS